MDEPVIINRAVNPPPQKPEAGPWRVVHEILEALIASHNELRAEVSRLKGEGHQ